MYKFKNLLCPLKWNCKSHAISFFCMRDVLLTEHLRNEFNYKMRLVELRFPGIRETIMRRHINLTRL